MLNDPADPTTELAASPITDLAASAVQLHELFTAFTDAEFTEGQALRLLIGVMTAGASES